MLKKLILNNWKWYLLAILLGIGLYFLPEEYKNIVLGVKDQVSKVDSVIKIKPDTITKNNSLKIDTLTKKSDTL